VTPKDILAANFNLPKDVFDAFPKGETYIQRDQLSLFRKLSMRPGRRNRCTKFRLLRDPKAAREFAGGTFRLATVDEFPASKTMSGGLMIINKGRQRDLHWHVNANKWQYYLRGKGQVVLFGSDGRSKVAEWGRAARSTCPPDSGTPSRTPAMTISRSCRPGTTVNLRRST